MRGHALNHRQGPADPGRVVDITTTSVGRDTIITTYRSFFSQVSFSGHYRVFVTIDPAYEIPEEESRRVEEFLRTLPETHPRVREVVVDRLPRQVGLQGALAILLARTTAPIGVHLEDDWEFTGPIDLDLLVEELATHGGTQIVLTNSHVARGGTFERAAEVEPVPASRAGLLRLTAASWAAHYLPLCPHLHRTEVWAPTIARALALTDPLRCPDERVRERIIAEQTTGDHDVLWTPRVVADDIGRAWLERRGGYKAITPEHRAAAEELPPPPTSGGPLRLARSAALLTRAAAVIPGITQTFHKRPENFAPGAYPGYAERGSGAVLWDADGNGYVDFVMALGAATLGYDHPAINNVLRERLGRGTLLSLPSPSEVAAAEELTAALPGVDMVRFLKTGAEACAAAVRLARHHTGRERILLAGYHGWHDQLSGPSPGVPAAAARLGERHTLDDDADDQRFLAALRDEGDELAAVLLSTPYHRRLRAEFLHDLRAACDRTGTLLVLDEIVTGFRLAPGGLGQWHRVRADLVCLSKGLAAGLPLAAVAGPAGVLADLARLRVSTTFGGELLALEAMRVALREYARGDYYRHIATLGRRLRDGVNAEAARLGLAPVLVGYDPMPCLRLAPEPADHARRAEQLLAGMARRGFLLRRDVNFVSAAHTTGQIDAAVAAAAEALTEAVADTGRWHGTGGGAS
ncbi:aminotransferase class III-fold pyridoxal phosphate-dependent enzyme [Streptomyces sp. DSM 44915]|uniref:Aminotransferase class III-fold pyridoxal phosphate-dependent enzyme n=1 Tax=Streptomyces chisholmiae TaxID=3075540 RepID=A0ABU2JPJ4_9ACTN|nr:aminotransferase class III-fold pyridoxal phosphate-dependent enzyme [Streptomyces sp. DSM 44915]MDT0266827.1 aminotransferase class III-fold pyridoxal phosphate-dependent enzyme [Streptomyces sp. DSM 44915]